MPIIGRLTSIAIHLTSISTILAGVKRTTGYSPDPSTIPLLSDPSISPLFARYLSFGEHIFDYTAAYAHSSRHFNQTNPVLGMAEGVESIRAKMRQQQQQQQQQQGGQGGQQSKGGSWWGGAK